MIDVGIDLGSRTARIGHISAQGVPQLFPDRHDSRAMSTVSSIHLDEDVALVGEPVEAMLDENPYLEVVRPLSGGGPADEILVRDALGRDWSRVAANALLISKLVNDAAASKQSEIGTVAIAVRPLATPEEREVVTEAVRAAGLGEPRLVEAPLAAAAHYGLCGIDDESELLVFDLGARASEVSVLRGSSAGPRIVATTFLPAGADDVEAAVARLLLSELEQVTGAIRAGDPGLMRVVSRSARELIASLGESQAGVARRSILVGDLVHEVCLTRTQLDWLLSDMVQGLLDSADRCLDEASSGWSDLEAVLLVGGGAKIAGLTDAIRSRLDRSRTRLLIHEPEAALTYGAARWAALGEPCEERRTAPRSLNRAIGLRVRGDGGSASGIHVMIDQGNPLPACHTTTLYTHRSGQDRVPLEVVVGAGAGDELVSLGRFVFGPIPNADRNHPVEVTLECRRAGDFLLSVSDPRSGQREAWTLEDPGLQREVRFVSLVEQIEATPVNP